ncbi:hypothetical protein GIB67_012095 [Kingdonia uniflora]|uniref:Protein MON2 homolog n=1 Tax=Kingdonia uniflora TaxID=39325 RepID=A0A7J7LHX3_9MAGN|nr:hypothetical protein GIB67_012095 [Kingdonia uniflora]
MAYSLLCIQEVSSAVPKLTKESSGQYSDFQILSSLNSQLFESSALMHISAVKSLLSALRMLSNHCMSGTSSGSGQTASQHIGSIGFSVERMISILINNLHRVEPLWDQVVEHLLELADNSSQHLRYMALEALDQSICAVLGSDQNQGFTLSKTHLSDQETRHTDTESRSFECAVITPLKVLYFSTENLDVRAGSLKILLHVLERYGEKLFYSWPNILELLRSVADTTEKDLISLGFQSIRVIMNDGLSTMPSYCLDICIQVTGAYSLQKTDLNISLTAIGLLWTTTDFIAKGLIKGHSKAKQTGVIADVQLIPELEDVKTVDNAIHTDDKFHDSDLTDRDKLLFSIFSLLQKLAADQRPECSSSASTAASSLTPGRPGFRYYESHEKVTVFISARNAEGLVCSDDQDVMGSKMNGCVTLVNSVCSSSTSSCASTNFPATPAVQDQTGLASAIMAASAVTTDPHTTQQWIQDTRAQRELQVDLFRWLRSHMLHSKVRNSAIRTLFQSLGSHGQKLSTSMWEDCLWNYVFPTLDRVSHMAATSSTVEWQGKELGMQGGKAVHMLIHHSRNTAQKQWDETLVLVLGGITRLLRSFFPFLRSLNNFLTGWESLLLFVRNSILNGNKEVALAAINCLQTTVLSHSPKGNLPMPYLKSVLDVYEYVLQRSPNCSAIAASKIKQEILHGLGELYVHAQKMFDDGMYMQLLEIMHLAVQQPKGSSDNAEADIEHVPPVQRTMLEILPLLHPTEHLVSMWSYLLRELLHYLPGSEIPLQNTVVETEKVGGTDCSLERGNMETHLSVDSLSCKQKFEVSHITPTDNRLMPEYSNGVASICQNKIEAQFSRSDLLTTKHTEAGPSSHLFVEKVIPVLVDAFQSAPLVEKYNIFPEIIQALGRCMTTRRDNPDGSLWRLAVEGFNHILDKNVSSIKMGNGTDQNISRVAITRFWKEVADVYEIFLVGSCGRALPSTSLSSATLKADENLEITVLDVLGDKVLWTQVDAPPDVIILLNLFCIL